MSDYPEQMMMVQGLQPNHFKTIVSEQIVEHHSFLDKNQGWLAHIIGHPEASALDYGEILYTPRGS